MNQLFNITVIRTFFLILAFFLAGEIYASGSTPENLIYNGRVIRPDGSALDAADVTFFLEVYSTGVEECLLYSEEHVRNMTMAEGYVTLKIGEGVRPGGGGYEITANVGQAFNNASVAKSPLTCGNGDTSYTPAPTDQRILRVSFREGTGPVVANQDLFVGSVPYAQHAASLGGRTSNEFIQTNSGAGVTQSNVETVFGDFTELVALLNGTSGQYTRPSSSGGSALPRYNSLSSYVPVQGDIWFDTDSNQVKYHDGTGPQVVSNAANLSLTEADIPELTSAGNGVDGGAITAGTIGGTTAINTSGAIATGGNISTTGTLSSSGNLSTGANLSVSGTTSATGLITATGGLTTTTNITATGDGSTTGVITGQTLSGARVQGREIKFADAQVTPSYVTMRASNNTGTYTLTLPAVAPGVGQVLSSDASGNLSWISPSSGSVTGITGTAPISVDNSTAATPVISVSNATTTDIGVVQLAADGGTTAGTVVQATDARLTDSRAPSGTASGDLSGSYPSPVVSKIQGIAVSTTDPLEVGQVLRYNGSTEYAPSFLNLSDLRSSISPFNQAFPAASCTAGQTMTWTSITDQLVCTDIALDDSQINFAVQSQNTIFAAPSAADGAPVFRALVSDDLPDLDWAKITSGTPSTLSGYGINDAVRNAGGATSLQSGLNASKPVAGTSGRVYISTDTKEIYRDNGTSWELIASAAGAGGTVTSVGVTAPLSNTGTATAPVIALSGTVSLANLADNNTTSNLPLLSGGSGGDPTYGQLSLSTAVSGTLPVLNGGTGATTATAARTNLGLKEAAIADVGGAVGELPSFTTAMSADSLLRWNDTAKGLEPFTCALTEILQYTASGWDCVAMPSSTDALAFHNGGDSFGGLATIGTDDNNDFAVVTNGTEKMRVLANGNVGIGTTAPAWKLSVAGGTSTALFTTTDYVAGTTGTGIGITPGVATGNTYGSIQTYNSGGAGAGALALQLSGGNVGIGTTSPSSKLDIAGSIQIANGGEACSVTGDGGMIRYNAGSLQFCNGSSWQTLGVSGAGLTSLGGQTGSTQTFAVGTTGLAPAFSSGSNTHTLNLPLASGAGVTRGLISKTDYDSFAAKLSSEFDPKMQTLATAEVDQLETIDSVTITNAQWSYLGAMSGQPLEATDSLPVDQISSATGKYLSYMPNGIECADNGILKWVAASDQWECSTDTNTDAVASVFGRTGVVVSASGDYTATQVTNTTAGNIAATTVQAAINELDTEKQPLDAQLTDVAGVSPTTTTGNYLSSNGTNLVMKTAAQVRADLDLEPGTDVQGQSSELSALAAVSTTGTLERTAANTYSTYSVTAVGKALLDDTTTTAQRTTLGLGSMATQNSNAVAITGGAINGTTIGATTPSTGAFTTLSTTGPISSGGNINIAAAKTLGLGVFTTTEENTLISSLASTDSGKSWYNATTQKVMYWDGGSAKALGTTAGTVTGVTGNAPISVTSGTTTPVISVADATTAAKGVVTLAADNGTTANTVVQASDSRLSNARAPSGTASGDLSGTYPGPTVAKIQGTAVATTTPTTGQLLKYNGTSYTPSNFGFGDLRTALGAQQMPATSCTSSQVLTWSSITDAFSCTNISVADSQLSYGNQTQNKVLAAPVGSTGAPTFRALAVADIPGLPWSKITSGTPTTLSGYGITDALINGGNTGAVIAGTNNATALTLETNNLARVTVDATGNVGIGTTVPDLGVAYTAGGRVLSVVGDGSAVPQSTGILMLANQRTTPTVGDFIGVIDFVSKGNGAAQTQVGARISAQNEGLGGSNGFGGLLAFSTKANNSTSFTERMRIDSSGNVGIGTSAPSTKLEVNGGIKATSFNGMNIFLKGGNNGTATCEAFCTNTGGAWAGGVGICLGSKRLSDGKYISCDVGAGSTVDCMCASW